MNHSSDINSIGTSIATHAVTNRNNLSAVKKDNDGDELQEGKVAEASENPTKPQQDPASLVGLNIDVKA